jgi:hypothetical protein
VFNGYLPFESLAYIESASPSWRILLRHLSDRDWPRAADKAGIKMPINAVMMPITTSNSTSVKPLAHARIFLVPFVETPIAGLQLHLAESPAGFEVNCLVAVHHPCPARSITNEINACQLNLLKF